MRSALSVICGACALLATTVAVASSRPADAFRTSSGDATCRLTYDYAGAQNASARSGIRVMIKTIRAPRVAAGHVAGWVGVGGPGRGPNGTTEWLQTGYSAMKDWPEQIYYEVTLPDRATRYHTVKASLAPGEAHVVGVAEVKGRRGSWQVLLDGKPVSPVIALPGSHRRFPPQVLAETWNAGTKQCNHYGYSFQSIRVAFAPGGPWTMPKSGYVWRDRQNQAVRTSRDSFVARSATGLTVNARDVPPLLGPFASRLAGRRLTAECHAQQASVIERPAGHLLLSRPVCEILLGYAVAQPDVPRANTLPGFEVAMTALGFLRGVAQAARAQPPQVDCRAVGWFARTMRLLGATPSQALALRDVLLRHRALLKQSLSFQPGCRFR